MPERIAEVTALLAEVLAPRAPLTVIVDGGDPGAAAAFAAKLAAAFPSASRAWSIDAVLGLTGPGGGLSDSALNVLEPATDRILVFLRGGPRHRFAEGDGERRAQVVIDHRDPEWPVIRQIDPYLADPDRWYLSESRAFFAARAADWDSKFGDDMPRYEEAVRLAGVKFGDVVLDVGCGTGRALPALAAAAGSAPAASASAGHASAGPAPAGPAPAGPVPAGPAPAGSAPAGSAPAGSTGRVIGLDFTPGMLEAARKARRDEYATLILADARRLPIADAAADVLFAAGLVHHLPDAVAGLTELARVTRPGGVLAIFHPTGRAALAARHGRTLRPDEPLSEDRLGPLLTETGWKLRSYEDEPERFLALAVRLEG